MPNTEMGMDNPKILDKEKFPKFPQFQYEKF